MERAASFDRFDELLSHRDWVRRVARALVRDDATADDLAQEVWLAAARAERPRSPRAWLGTVLRNTASNLGRSARRRERRESAAPPPRALPSASEMLERAEIVERVARAVRTLDEPYRTVVFLRWFEDLSPPEIAARLGEPLETVRTRLRRALAELREQLDAEHGGDRRAWMLVLLPVARTQGHPAPATPLAVPTAILGGSTMFVATKLVLGTAAAVTLAAAAWWAMPGGESAPPVATAPSDERETAVTEPESAAAPRPRPREDAEEKTAAAQSPRVEAETEAVVGRVIDDATGAPVARARVRLGYGNLIDERYPAGVSGDDGRFRIDGIGAGDLQCHRLLVAADGYAEALPSVYGWNKRAKPGQPTDLGEFRLERGARVAGRVLAADGSPVAGAAILFCRETRTTSPPTFHANESNEVAKSDAEGRFAIERAPPAEGDFHHTLFAVTPDGFGWLELPRLAGKKEFAGLELRLAKTAAITVKVRAAGAAVVGARVLAVPHFPPLGTKREWPAVHELYVGRPELKPVFEAVTDETGTVRLQRLPMNGDACVYDLVVRLADFAPGIRDGLRLAPGESKEITIDLEPFRAVAITGSVRAADGTPIAGAHVDFACQKNTVTDAAGAFRIEGIDPSAHDHGAWVTVEAEGFAKETRSYRFAGTGELPLAVPSGVGWLPRSGDPPPMDFVLGRAVELEVHIADEAGAPVRGVQITVRNGQTSGGTRFTGLDGQAEVTAAPGPGNVLVIYPPQPSLDYVLPDDVPVPAQSGEVKVVLRRVPPSARLVAEVVDAATGEPLDPTDVMLVPVDWTQMPRVCWPAPVVEHGRVIVARAFPGDHLLWIGAAGHAPARVEVHVAQGQEEVRVVVRCGMPGTIRGVIDGYGARGRTMLGLNVPGPAGPPDWVKLQSDPKLTNAAWIAEDGTFRIDGVPPGKVLLFRELDGARVHEIVDVPSGGTIDVVLHPVATGRVRFLADDATTRFAARWRGPDGAWTNWMAVSPRGGKPAEWATNTPLGRVQWQVRRAALDKWPAQDAPADASGEIDARAGEPVLVPIPAR